MTRDETIQLLAYLEAAYPTTELEAKDVMIGVWQDVLGPLDGDPVRRVLPEVVRRHGRFPTPHAIVDAVSSAAVGELPSEVEAWRACTSQSLGEDLHPVLRDCIAQTGGVTTLAWCEEREMQRRVRSAYWRAVERFRSQTAALEGLPAELPQSSGPRLGGEPRMIECPDAAIPQDACHAEA